MNPNKVNVVIYHHPCADGNASAYVANKYATENNLQYKFCGIKTDSSETFTSELTDLIKDQVVLFIDYAPTKGQYEIAKQIVKEMYILDHHVTNEKEYKDKPNTIFDMNLSGVGLAWNFFFPEKPLPVYLKMIQERDLWKFETSNTKEFTNGLYYCAGEKLSSYCDVMKKIELDESYMNTIIDLGILIEQHKQSKISNIVDNTKKVYNYNGFKCAIVNCDYDIASDLGSALMNTNNYDFAVLWRYDHTKEIYILSLRSSDKSKFDVSELAKKMGGGGHRNASGCTMTTHPSEYFNTQS